MPSRLEDLWANKEQDEVLFILQVLPDKKVIPIIILSPTTGRANPEDIDYVGNCLYFKRFDSTKYGPEKQLPVGQEQTFFIHTNEKESEEKPLAFIYKIDANGIFHVKDSNKNEYFPLYENGKICERFKRMRVEARIEAQEEEIKGNVKELTSTVKSFRTNLHEAARDNERYRRLAADSFKFKHPITNEFLPLYESNGEISIHFNSLSLKNQEQILSAIKIEAEKAFKKIAAERGVKEIPSVAVLKKESEKKDPQPPSEALQISALPIISTGPIPSSDKATITPSSLTVTSGLNPPPSPTLMPAPTPSSAIPVAELKPQWVKIEDVKEYIRLCKDELHYIPFRIKNGGKTPGQNDPRRATYSQLENQILTWINELQNLIEQAEDEKKTHINIAKDIILTQGRDTNLYRAYHFALRASFLKLEALFSSREELEHTQGGWFRGFWNNKIAKEDSIRLNDPSLPSSSSTTTSITSNKVPQLFKKKAKRPPITTQTLTPAVPTSSSVPTPTPSPVPTPTPSPVPTPTPSPVPALTSRPATPPTSSSAPIPTPDPVPTPTPTSPARVPLPRNPSPPPLFSNPASGGSTLRPSATAVPVQWGDFIGQLVQCNNLSVVEKGKYTTALNTGRLELDHGARIINKNGSPEGQVAAGPTAAKGVQAIVSTFKKAGITIVDITLRINDPAINKMKVLKSALREDVIPILVSINAKGQPQEGANSLWGTVCFLAQEEGKISPSTYVETKKFIELAIGSREVFEILMQDFNVDATELKRAANYLRLDESITIEDFKSHLLALQKQIVSPQSTIKAKEEAKEKLITILGRSTISTSPAPRTPPGDPSPPTETPRPGPSPTGG